MRVVTVGQVAHSLGHKLGLAEEKEADVAHSRSLHVVVDVRDRKLEQLLHRLRVHRAGVGAADCVHGTLSHDSVLRAGHLLDQAIGLHLTALHEESEGDAQSADNLLVLAIVGVSEHLFDASLIGTAQHDHAHGVGGSLTDRGRVGVGEEGVLQVLIDVGIFGSHADETQTEGNAVLHSLVLACVLVAVHEEFVCLWSEIVGVDQTIGVVSASCAVRAVVLAGATCEVDIEDVLALRLVTLMDHAEGGDDHEAVPVDGLLAPRHVVLDEAVVRRVCVHYAVHP
mmetsp:Transcript_3854/g.4480  ORF Transcript_3854/g.4480 Transcript_3854/m.4480 type:complete len:283 (-) Transcript_3854:1112-1960(-)